MNGVVTKRCPKCGVNLMADDPHTDCRFVGPNPPPSPHWPTARAVDDGAAHCAALAEAARLLDVLHVELEQLDKERGDGPWWHARRERPWGAPNLQVADRARIIAATLRALLGAEWWRSAP